MTREYEVFEECKATKSEILNCSFGRWYPLLKDVAVESRVVALPAAFLEYLSSDSIKIGSKPQQIEPNSDNEYSDWSDDEQGDDPTQNFTELTTAIDEIIAEFGAVAPKLNWSAPKDATWMMPGNTMKCINASDVYLLLKSSNHVTHDLEFPFEECSHDAVNDVQYELALRRWADVNPALEFRVFVRDGGVVGISQRDMNFYSYLEELVSANDFNDKIHKFMAEVIERMPNRHFIADIYIAEPYRAISVIDINPFTRISDSLMFTWNELLVESHPEIRLVQSQSMAQFKTKNYSESQVPIDVINASNDPQALVELAKFWHSEMEKSEK